MLYDLDVPLKKFADVVAEWEITDLRDCLSFAIARAEADSYYKGRVEVLREEIAFRLRHEDK